MKTLEISKGPHICRFVESFGIEDLRRKVAKLMSIK